MLHQTEECRKCPGRRQLRWCLEGLQESPGGSGSQKGSAEEQRGRQVGQCKQILLILLILLGKAWNLMSTEEKEVLSGEAGHRGRTTTELEQHDTLC